MARTDDDASFLRAIPNGVLEEFRAEVYSSTFIKKYPVMFVDTAWVDIDKLKTFLHEQEESKHVERDPDTSKHIKEEHVASPNSVIKEEPKSDAVLPAVSANAHLLYRSLIEDGCEILELLDSDDEMASDSESFSELIEDKGMSSDTVVGDLDIEMDSDDDEDLHSHHDQKMSDRSTDLGSDSDDSGCDEFTSSNWLEDCISSQVKQGPILITRQCTVEALEVLECTSDLPSYWPVPREKRGYLVDLSDPKWNILDKNGKLISVDGLIKNSDQDSWTGCTGNGPRDSVAGARLSLAEPRELSRK
ncbi:hypothetical protein B0H34DRAFT_801758 [Crassisporium funariophilum]|nr:hypothetical protein B0H34DRAFT_801758 [Crassisporium funariophilum]